MVHMIEPTHRDRFVAILDEHYPTWREARAELNELPLAAEVWRYWLAMFADTAFNASARNLPAEKVGEIFGRHRLRGTTNRHVAPHPPPLFRRS